MKSNTPITKQQFDTAIPLIQPGEKTIYLRWRILLTIFLLILLVLLTMMASAAQPVEAASSSAANQQRLTNPKVVAFYYTWFDEASWNSTLSDQPAQAYISRDRGVMGRHIDQAKQAGIDGFVVAWYGPTTHNNQTEPNLSALLEEAAARNFQIGILFETNSPFFSGVGDVSNALSHALSTHVHHPAYLRAANGQPVLFFWRSQAYSVDTWRGVRNQVDPGYGSVWIGEGIDTSYLAVFDGHHLYSNTWNPPSDLTYTNQKFANWVAQASSQLGTPKSWVATVMPGYNDVGIRPGSGFAQSREGGGYFDRSWQAAINSNPAWIVINSFNEWPEGSYIEPSTTYGDQFIHQAARWSQQFKQGAGSQQITLPDTVPQNQPIQAAKTLPVRAFSEGETVEVAVSLLNLRSGPGTNTQILTTLTQGEQLSIVSQQEQWAEVASAEKQGWVHASMVEPSALPVASTLPAASPVATSNTPRTVGELLPRFIPNRSNPNYALKTGYTVVVNVTLLNLRSGPNTNADVLAALPYGAQLVVEDLEEQYPDWIQVKSADSDNGTEALIGWVYGSMVK